MTLLAKLSYDKNKDPHVAINTQNYRPLKCKMVNMQFRGPPSAE